MLKEKSDKDSDYKSVEKVYKSDEENKNEKASSNSALYTLRSIPVRRRHRNIIAEAPRVTVQPLSEKESFQPIVIEEILITSMMQINR